MMSKALLLLGANLPNRVEVLKEAKKLISKSFHVVRSGSWFESKSWGFDGGDFINYILEIDFEEEPEELLGELLSIEQELGRVRSKTSGYQDRSIDIDILFIDQLIINTDTLQIPHPRIAERKFVLKPLMEFWSDFVHPELEKSIVKLYEDCPDKSSVTKI